MIPRFIECHHEDCEDEMRLERASFDSAPGADGRNDWRLLVIPRTCRRALTAVYAEKLQSWKSKHDLWSGHMQMADTYSVALIKCAQSCLLDHF